MPAHFRPTGLISAASARLRASSRCAAVAVTAGSMLLSACASALGTPTYAWSASEGRPLASADLTPSMAGWACSQAVELPPGSGYRMLALCRRAASSQSAELQLLLLPLASGGPPKVLARLRDASKATLRVFTPAQGCAAASPCIAAVVLVDQRDEGICYGTQVVALPAGKAPLNLGFIDEWTPGAGESVCVGAVARLSGSPASVDIDLPGPLARTGRDGNPIPVSASSVQYRIPVGRPALMRQDAAR